MKYVICSDEGKMWSLYNGDSDGNNRELKQQQRQRQRKRHLKINIWEMVTSYVVIIASSSHPLLLTEHAANGLVEAPLK